ncbi:MAG: hypothetical protein CSA55_05785 [Ilumatobacter coccineus]|uniref:Uncharacterized protein n=1 Tax=Ilumatobacter coccineus TaxID=467094 RepID=A0A2G6K7K6_9ACTN|nr:MAG: hypothetical protein CSA55_05785 [Ilumatobacter coccineus]
MELDNRTGMTVAELIDILSEHPGDAVVEMAIIAPVGEDDDDITVDRYVVDGVMPWDEDGEGETVWMVGGNDDDVEVFLDAIEIVDEGPITD